MRRILEAEGVTVHCGAEQLRVARQGTQIEAGFEAQGKAGSVSGSHLLLAVGRIPNTDDLGCDKAGIVLDKRGYITVDDQLQTSVPGVWALGDVNGRGAFTHTSYPTITRSSPPTYWTMTRAASATPHSDLCPVHRPAAGTRRHDRGRGARRYGKNAASRRWSEK